MNKFGLIYEDYENNFFNTTKLENEVKYILQKKNLDLDIVNQFYEAILKIRR